MASWLKRLSVAFVVAGAAGGTYILLHGKHDWRTDAAKFRPTFNEFVDQGQAALRTLIESANAPRRDPQPEIDQAKLPFIVIEPRDFAAPVIRLPSQLAAETRPVAITDLRLTHGPDQPAMDLEPVAARLRARVPEELFGYFDLYLYVSKARPEKGSWAQRMFVLAKQPDRALRMLHNWPVSTGLEEPLPAPSGKVLGTDTPQGIFKLDRGRFYEDYTSRQWESPMPFAMFFDWQINGRPSGMAIHGTDAEGEKVLGQRASHGCIRLATENARTLFHLIRDNYRGRVPVFAVNPDSGTMSTTGVLVRDETGRVQMTQGYKVLVFIEDYGGPSVDTIAALY
jgi:hypothetical protein